MMNKVIVTLRSAPSASIEVPQTVKVDGKKRDLDRSCFGALRLFPGVPKTVTKDELEHIKSKEPDLYLRLEVRAYVESKRVDVRGASEADIEKMAKVEGLDHLKPKAQVAKLQERGKLKRPEPAERAVPLKGEKPKKPAPEPPRTTRKPKNGNGGGK